MRGFLESSPGVCAERERGCGGAPGGLTTPDRHPLSPEQATTSPARVSGRCLHASFLPRPLINRPPPVSTCHQRVTVPITCAFPYGAALARGATVGTGLSAGERGVVADVGRWTG